MLTRVCEVCEKVFGRPGNVSTAVFLTRQFCSLKCFGASIKKNRLCPLCQLPVQNRNNKRYCSWECAKRRPELKRTGIAHQSWKGGRTVDPSGHIRIRMDADHMWASKMRMRHGYVLVHRLVMANHLNRALENYETVHHINGQVEDNRLENLQLRQGRHGRGASFECLDCGSRNIGPVKI